MDAYSHIASVKIHKEKLDMFSKIRKIILNKRLTITNQGLNINKWQAVDRTVLFPKDDSKSFLDTFSESIEDSTLFKRLYQRYVGKQESGYGDLPKEEPVNPRYHIIPPEEGNYYFYYA